MTIMSSALRYLRLLFLACLIQAVHGKDGDFDEFVKSGCELRPIRVDQVATLQQLVDGPPIDGKKVTRAARFVDCSGWTFHVITILDYDGTIIVYDQDKRFVEEQGLSIVGRARQIDKPDINMEEAGALFKSLMEAKAWSLGKPVKFGSPADDGGVLCMVRYHDSKYELVAREQPGEKLEAEFSENQKRFEKFRRIAFPPVAKRKDK